MSHDSYDLVVFHESETEALLKKLNLLEEVDAGQVECAVCRKTITKGNFGGVLRKGDTILLVCDDLDCLQKAGGQGQ